MADEEEKAVEEKEEKSGKKKPSIFQNRLVIVAIIIVAQVGIALMVGKMITSKAEKKKEEEAAATEEQVWDERGNIVMLDNIIVNIKQRDKLYFLKMAIGLEVSSAKMQKEVEDREALLRDVVISTVSGRSVQELDSMDERNALKVDLYKKLNDSLVSGDLIQVYFSDFVIQ